MQALKMQLPAASSACSDAIGACDWCCLDLAVFQQKMSIEYASYAQELQLESQFDVMSQGLQCYRVAVVANECLIQSIEQGWQPCKRLPAL